MISKQGPIHISHQANNVSLVGDEAGPFADMTKFRVSYNDLDMDLSSHSFDEMLPRGVRFAIKFVPDDKKQLSFIVPDSIISHPGPGRSKCRFVKKDPGCFFVAVWTVNPDDVVTCGSIGFTLDVRPAPADSTGPR